MLTDQPGKDAWPISGATFILMHKAQDKPANAANALKFFDWAYANGDKMADDLEYVPLPDGGEGRWCASPGRRASRTPRASRSPGSKRRPASAPRAGDASWPRHCPRPVRRPKA